MIDPFSTDSIVVAAVGLLVTCGLTSSFVSSIRLKRWSDAEGVTILKKRYAARLGSDFSARGFFAGWCYYVKIEDQQKQVFSGWVRVGGILAAITDAEFEVVWDNRPSYLKPE